MRAHRLVDLDRHPYSLDAGVVAALADKRGHPFRFGEPLGERPALLVHLAEQGLVATGPFFPQAHLRPRPYNETARPGNPFYGYVSATAKGICGKDEERPDSEQTDRPGSDAAAVRLA